MQNSSIFRLILFIVVLVILTVFERIIPALRNRKNIRGSMNNLFLIATGSILTGLITFVLSISPVIVSEGVTKNGTGLLQVFSLHPVISIIIGIVILDFVIYIQHILFHAIPLLWQLHMVHHSDHHVDATTALRFHPLEIVVSLIIKLGAVALIGAPVLSVILFEIILNASSMFNHANIRLPRLADRIIRLIIITPSMHRVHHCVIINETNSNFGFFLSIWDRLFGTYIKESVFFDDIRIGISHIPPPGGEGLINVLTMPFMKKGGNYPLTRHNHRGMKSINRV